MDRFERPRGWMVVLGVVLLSALAGIVAYNIGLSHGVAESATGGGDLPYRHGHWGVGFGFPFLFLLFWFVLLRWFWWGGGWGWGGPWRRHGYYYPEWPDVPPSFDDWHRRAHERMDARDRVKEQPSADDPGRRG